MEYAIENAFVMRRLDFVRRCLNEEVDEKKEVEVEVGGRNFCDGV
jgi:hypothetical protein